MKKQDNKNLSSPSSEGGYPLAMLQMFVEQYDGRVPGGKRDARKWLDRAVHSGESDILFYVGRACYFGKRMPVDYGKALALFTESTHPMAVTGRIRVKDKISAAVNEWSGVINFFESHNVPFNMRIDADGNTIMHLAAKKNDSYVVTYLMGRGVKPALNKHGDLPKPPPLFGRKIRNINHANHVSTEITRWEHKIGKRLPNDVWAIIAEFHGVGFPKLRQL